MEIKRDLLLKRLIDLRHNGMIKVVTGMRRCGKSYLLFNLFTDALKAKGVDEENIVQINLEDRRKDTSICKTVYGNFGKRATVLSD